MEISRLMEILKKEPLVSVDQLKRIIGDFKRHNRFATTNYIPNLKLHSLWASSGSAYIYTFEGGIMVTFDNGTMLDTIFIANSGDDVRAWMKTISIKCGRPVVVEHVVREGKDTVISSPDHILRRMSRCGVDEDSGKSSDCVEKAREEDIPIIREIFHLYFDPLTERIPDEEELEKLIHNRGISIIRDKNGITGMVIYEKNPSSIHLRYWWVAPEQRGRGVGSALLREYFNSGSDRRRQFLWVFSDNSDAIDKYRHYGFEFDGVADYIYVIKDK